MKKEKKAKPETARARIDFDTARPRQIEAFLREVIRKAFGDTVENQSSVFSSRGYYTVWINSELLVRADGAESAYHFENFRRTEAPRIAKAIRALAAA